MIRPSRLLLVLFALHTAVRLAAGDARITVQNRFTAQGTLLVGARLTDASASLGWKPELFGEFEPFADCRLSGDVSMDNRLELVFEGGDPDQDIDLSLYRAWLAASWKQTELKAGLQHIRMGVAQIYRPLQWFDDLVPGSFLQESQGVRALTLSHFFPNPELRVWALPGTGKTKGRERIATRKGVWELGGRAGLINAGGETGISFLHRILQNDQDPDNQVREFRFGLDQRLDGFMGCWLEADFNYLSHEIGVYEGGGFVPEPRYYGSATIGGDYTFAIGNGLYILGEGNYEWGRAAQSRNESCWSGAVLLNYPLGLLDGLQWLGAYQQEDKRLSGMLSWRRTYDKLSWDLSLGFTQSDYEGSGKKTGLASLTINYDI